ncbi:MAG: homoserine kinase [Verrucomicrobiota bacterium]
MNSHTPSRVVVRIPGSTSNCGSGFDSLGLALQVYNRVTLTARDDGRQAAERESDARAADMVAATVAAMAKRAPAVARVGFTYRIEGDVPPARGLGSSITVIGGVLAGLNVLADAGLDREALVAIANELEGHPDNAAAGILGGFCVARCDPDDGRYLGTVRVALPPELRFVVVSPSVEMLTKESRGVLPAQLPYFDAVRSINAANYLVAALATGEFGRLRDAVGDYMHEPYRLPRIKGGREAIAAGVAAGAYTGWLSGSGSSVLCVAPQEVASAVGAAMQAAFAAEGIPSEVRDLAADNVGCRVE